MRDGKPLAIDLYAGLGGWTEGLLAEGYEVIGYDIEAHEYGDMKYPATLVLQDVLTLHGSQFKDADLIVASPPCFVADTLILTARGLVPIPEVMVGDMVLTHRLRWRPVLRTGSTLAPTLIASGYGGSLEGTAEHPVYVRHDAGSRQQWDKAAKAPAYQPKDLQPPAWTALSEIKGCHWGNPAQFEPLPVPDMPNGLSSGPDFWWMVGRWVGDGWTRHRDGQGDEVIICCAHDEADDLDRVLCSIAPRSGLRAALGELHWRRSRERTTERFTAASNSLAQWLARNFGRGADGKSFPSWTLGMTDINRRAMLDGYASADGYEGINGPSRIAKATTVSKALALSTRMLAASLGMTANVSFFRRPKTAIIEGRTVQQRDTWQVSWTLDDQANRLVERSHGHLWGKVRDVTPSQPNAQVWNLEVADDNSYVADGITVHNCQEYSYMAMPWSLAKAKAKAIREDTTGEKLVALNRLFNACFRIQAEASLAAGRYVPMVVENVRGAQPWVGRARWNFGSFFLWGDVPALMPQSFGSIKAPGMNWSDPTKRGQDFTRLAGKHAAGIKQPGIGGPRQNGKGDAWFQDGAARHGSKSPQRKAASAMIAKIPEPLTRHIGKVYYPR